MMDFTARTPDGPIQLELAVRLAAFRYLGHADSAGTTFDRCCKDASSAWLHLAEAIVAAFSASMPSRVFCIPDERLGRVSTEKETRDRTIRVWITRSKRRPPGVSLRSTTTRSV